MSAAGSTRGAGRWPGRRRRAGARQRRPGTAALVLLAAAVAVTLLLALGARTVVARSWCADHPIDVSVAVSGQIAPAIEQFGRYFNRQHHDIGGHCASVSVRVAAPGLVAAQLSEGRPLRADAWIPDSTLWTAIARSTPAGARRARAPSFSVADSPLVIAMPRSSAARLPAFGSSVGWQFLLPPASGGPPTALGVHVRFPDPTQTGAGLSALIEMRRLLHGGAAGRAGLTRLVLNAQVVPAPGGGAPLAGLAAQQPPAGAPYEPVTVTSEQQAIQYDRAHPKRPLAIRYPAQGGYDLRFPYVVTAATRLAAAAAEQFGRLLETPYAASYLRFAGFRVDGRLRQRWPSWYALAPSRPAQLPPPTEAEAGAALAAWRRLTLGSRDLALVDVSSAMAERVAPGGPTLEQLLGKAAGVGLAHFPDSTQMGLWAFASRLDGALPYRALVPIGPLPGPFGLVSRRLEILRLTRSMRVLPGKPPDLYGAILAAYRHMVATYQPGYRNALLVLTAGEDSARGGVSAAALLRDLRSLRGPGRPVQIVAIMLGRGGDFRVLREIAAATGGEAAEITRPAQIGRVYYRAMARRLCQARCGP